VAGSDVSFRADASNGATIVLVKRSARISLSTTLPNKISLNLSNPKIALSVKTDAD